MKTIMKLRSLFFMMCIGMMFISVNSNATEDHEQNSKTHVLSVSVDAGMDQVAMLDVESIKLGSRVSEDCLIIVQCDSFSAVVEAPDIVALRNYNLNKASFKSYKYRCQSVVPRTGVSCSLSQSSNVAHVDPGRIV